MSGRRSRMPSGDTRNGRHAVTPRWGALDDLATYLINTQTPGNGSPVASEGLRAQPQKRAANDDDSIRSGTNRLRPTTACHAGGRGFESRRSRFRKSLQSGTFVRFSAEPSAGIGRAAARSVLQATLRAPSAKARDRASNPKRTMGSRSKGSHRPSDAKCRRRECRCCTAGRGHASGPTGRSHSPVPGTRSTGVHVSKLSSEAISRCNLGDVEYVVIEPAHGGMRLRPAGIEDQVQHEQEAGLGHVTYSLGEFLDEFTNAPSHPAPTSERTG